MSELFSGTSAIPSGMNDENLEDTSKYVSKKFPPSLKTQPLLTIHHRPTSTDATSSSIPASLVPLPQLSSPITSQTQKPGINSHASRFSTRAKLVSSHAYSGSLAILLFQTSSVANGVSIACCSVNMVKKERSSLDRVGCYGELGTVLDGLGMNCAWNSGEDGVHKLYH
jgi:hypothetical protein